MPKTPVQMESERYNPYITKSINRTLLTPCRQVGLSRKRKTPNSSNNSFSETDTTLVDSTSSNLNTTPLSSNTSLNNTTQEKEKTVKSEVTGDSKDKKKNRVSKRLIVEESDLKNEPQLTRLENNDTPEENKAPVESETFKDQVSKTSIRDDELSSVKSTKLSEKETPKTRTSDKNKSKSKSKSSEKKKSKRKIIERVDEDVIIVKNKEENASPGDSKEKPDTIEHSPDFQETEHFAKNVPLKTYSRENSKKIRSDTITVEVDEAKSEPEATVLKNVTNKEVPTNTRKSPRFSPIKPSSGATNVVPEKTKTIRRVLSLTSNFEDETKKSNMGSEIEELEKQIKEKQKLLDEFQQAQIYRKKHDIKELEELTSRWKTGCILALNDLLPLLQAHGNIDMATLLHNLKVPKELLSLSQNGDLI